MVIKVEGQKSYLNIKDDNCDGIRGEKIRRGQRRGRRGRICRGIPFSLFHRRDTTLLLLGIININEDGFGFPGRPGKQRK